MLTALFTMVLLFTAAVAALQARTRREAQRLEFQNRLLERVGSARELGEFLATDQGQRLLDSLASPSQRPGERVLSLVRGGTVVLTVGVALSIFLSTDIGGSMPGPNGPLALIGTILIATGLGMLISASVSYQLARRLGMFERETDTRRDRTPLA
jgi:hypothetical protein